MLAIYRTKSALQLKFIPPKMTKFPSQTSDIGDSRLVLKDPGAVFFEATVGENKVFDWSKKVNFAISDVDFVAMFEGFRLYELTNAIEKNAKGKNVVTGLIDIFLTHDPNAGTDKAGTGMIKTFKISNASFPGTYYLTISYMENKKVINSVSIPMTEGDLLRIKYLLMYCYPKTLGI